MTWCPGNRAVTACRVRGWCPTPVDRSARCAERGVRQHTTRRGGDMEKGELGQMIEAYRDREAARDQLGRRPTDADIARALKVSKSTVGNWIRGTAMPKQPHFTPLANLLGEPRNRVLDAALRDAGYLPKESDGRGNAAPIAVPNEPAATSETASLPDPPRRTSRSPRPARDRRGTSRT